MVKPAWLILLCWLPLCVKAAEVSHRYHWALGPPLPAPVQEIYPAVFQNGIVVAGGLSESDSKGLQLTGAVYELKPNSQQWQQLAPLPEPRHHPMLMAAGNTLWSFGGFIETEQGQWTNTGSVLRYDAAKDRWQSVNPMPKLVSETVSANLNGEIHITGGRTPVEGKNGQWRDQVDSGWHGVFLPKGGIWKTAAPLPTPRNSACSVVVEGRWHVIGGRTMEDGNLDTHEIYDPTGNQWIKAKPLPRAQGGLACVALHDGIYVFGGEYFNEGQGVYSEVWRYDLKRLNWSKVSVMPVPRHGLGAVQRNDEAWLIGGAAKAGAKDTRATVSRLQFAHP